MRTVLIVDDAAFMRNILKNILETSGYKVAGEAVNGNDGILKYKELKPDIVTMDITMPECDGLKAVKEIVDYDKTAKVVMCSAMGQQAMVIEAIHNGALDFIVKPFQKDRVIESLARVATK